MTRQEKEPCLFNCIYIRVNFFISYPFILINKVYGDTCMYVYHCITFIKDETFISELQMNDYADLKMQLMYYFS